MTLQLRYVAHSEIGLIRKNNQDSGFASPHLLAVRRDGGAAAGDPASAVAIDTIRQIEGAADRKCWIGWRGDPSGQRPDRGPGGCGFAGRHGHHGDRGAVRRD